MTRTVILAGDRQRAYAKTCEYCGAEFEKDERYSRRYFAKQKYCSLACSGKARSDAIANSDSWTLRFWSNVDVRGEDDCWTWTGTTKENGRGVLSVMGRQEYAPRLSLRLDGRPPLPSQQACHHCDNPNCVNPKHLYPGTATTNGRDMSSRGRVWCSKLTEDDVRKIRVSQRSPEELAEEYGVSPAAIRKAIARKSWRHVK